GKVPEADRAPAQGPAPPDGPPNLWQRYVAGRPPTPLATSSSETCLIDYQVYSPQLTRWWGSAYLAAQLVGPLGAGPAAAGPGEPRARGWVLRGGTPVYQRLVAEAMRGTPPGPPELPVLAVRAARRAVSENPTNAESHYALANAYWVTWREQERHL